MPRKATNTEMITIIAADDSVSLRGGGIRARKVELDINQLTTNVNIFLLQMEKVVAKAPKTVGRFALTELEVSAEITTNGQVLLLGVGGEIGATAGIRFVFKPNTQE
jgi:hypothetical protein